MDSLRGGGP